MQSKIHIVKNQIINFMSCCIDFHYWLYYWDISELCGMSGDLSEFFPLSLSQSYQSDCKKQNIVNLLSEKYMH